MIIQAKPYDRRIRTEELTHVTEEHARTAATAW